ncbi:hypothetical protein ISS06_00235 [Patescibacteria group bacterium]|nr:hypothetical protein [Patescibacteria group bacterium]
MSDKKNSLDKISIPRNKLINMGLIIVIFNPFPSGLIYGFFLFKNPKTKKYGELMIICSLFWGAISLALTQKYFPG